MTKKSTWRVVDAVSGSLQAEVIRGLLEAQGFHTVLSQEGAGLAYGMTVGPLGTVEILVPEGEFEDARALLDQYYRGDLEAYNENNDGDPTITP